MRRASFLSLATLLVVVGCEGADSTVASNDPTQQPPTSGAPGAPAAPGVDGTSAGTPAPTPAPGSGGPTGFVVDPGLEGAPFTLNDPACQTTATQVACTDVVYSVVGQTSLHLDLVAPIAAKTKKVPIIVYFHPGGWAVGSYHNPGLETAYYLNLGYAVASIEYRLTQNPDKSVSGVTFPQNLQDAKTAIRWVRTKATGFIDGAKIAAYGSSAGAHLSSLLATTSGVAAFEGRGNPAVPSNVAAAVLLSSPFNFHVFVPENPPLAPECDGLNTKKGQDPQELVPLLIGGDINDPANAPKLDALNAAKYVDATSAPIIAFNGTCDQVVPYHTTDVLAAAVAQKGLTNVSINIVPLAIHKIDQPAQMNAVHEFLKQHLGVTPGAAK